MQMSPVNSFGSGAAMVASVPLISTTPIRFNCESKENVACATPPVSKS
jgi:hypothetical protein